MRSIGTLGAASVSTVSSTPAAVTVLPRPDHVVIVIYENHQQPQVIGSSLAAGGANFTPVVRRHPPQPAQLPRVVQRQHSGNHQRLLPAHVQQRQPRPPADRRRADLRRLLGGPAVNRFHRLHLGPLRPQALALDELE